MGLEILPRTAPFCDPIITTMVQQLGFCQGPDETHGPVSTNGPMGLEILPRDPKALNREQSECTGSALCRPQIQRPQQSTSKVFGKFLVPRAIKCMICGVIGLNCWVLFECLGQPLLARAPPLARAEFVTFRPATNFGGDAAGRCGWFDGYKTGPYRTWF